MKIRSSQDWTYTKMLLFVVTVAFILILPSTSSGTVPPSKKRAKFYDFSEQVIDGTIKKPTALYTDSRQKVKFGRLLRLKRSFMQEVLNSAREPVFRR